MKYRIVKKTPYHFEIQYYTNWFWRRENTFPSMEQAQQHIEKQKAFASPGKVLQEGTI